MGTQMKIKQIKALNELINTFCDETGSVVTISNAKGLWTARVTNKAVQIMVVTGESILDCMINLDSKMVEKAKKLGLEV